jgi:hypothetical protein
MNAYGGGLLRRIARMEAKADRRFRAEQLDKAEQKKMRADGSFIIIANVCVITLYGNPRLDESLEGAWKRALEPLLQQFPNFARNGRAHPFNLPQLRLSQMTSGSTCCLACQVRTTTKESIAY